MKSSYQIKLKENRPPIASFPEGFFVQDYSYVQVSDETYLDEKNGRYCVTPDFPKGTYAYFATVNSVTADSIDYALLEKSNRVAVIPVDMGWTDLGSWESLHKVSDKDNEGNVLRGNVISQETKNSLIFSEKKLVASIGVENLIIVETDDALLVCDINRSQEVKELVERLKREKRNEY